jgi:ribonucleoside-diphosphate reductase alpha chain
VSEVWGVVPETLVLTDRGYETISSLEGRTSRVWNGYEFEETTAIKVATDTPIVQLKTENTLELLCSTNFIVYVQAGILTSDIETRQVKELSTEDKILRVPSCPISEGGQETFPYAYSHGFYSGSERYWRSRLKVSRASVYGVRRRALPELALDLDKTTTTSLFYRENLPRDFEVPLDPKYSVETKLEWLAGLFDSGLLKRKLRPTIWHLHSDNVDFLYQVKLLLQTLGVDSRHVANQDHRFQHYSLRITERYIEVLIDLGVPTLVRKLERSLEPRSKNGPTTSRSARVSSVEDALRTSDIYNFESTTRKAAVLNGMLTAIN